MILRDECITGKLYNEDNGVTVSSFNSKFKKVFDSLNKDFGKKMDYFGDVDGFSEEQKAGIKFIEESEYKYILYENLYSSYPEEALSHDSDYMEAMFCATYNRYSPLTKLIMHSFQIKINL